MFQSPHAYLLLLLAQPISRIGNVDSLNLIIARVHRNSTRASSLESHSMKTKRNEIFSWLFWLRFNDSSSCRSDGANDKF